MKPYFRVVYNQIKCRIIKLFCCTDFETDGIVLLDYNTKVVVKRNSHVRLGNRIISDGRMVMIVDDNANLEIGKEVYFNEGMMISSKNCVKIGAGCQFGPNVKIFDNNHCFNAQQGVLSVHKSVPILIGKNCWIAANVTILAGTIIGDNCVIGAGCVIRDNIPDGSIVTQERQIKIKRIEER